MPESAVQVQVLLSSLLQAKRDPGLLWKENGISFLSENQLAIECSIYGSPLHFEHNECPETCHCLRGWPHAVLPLNLRFIHTFSGELTVPAEHPDA